MDKHVRKQIKSLNFGLLSPEQIKKLSCAKIITPELYDIDGYPVDGGLMDLGLGAVDPGVRCRTCGGRLKECLGHPGSIEFARPVIHLNYIPIIEMFLRSFCKRCSKLMLKDADLEKYSSVERIKKAKDAKKCPHCGEEQERVKLDKPYNFLIGKRRIFPTEIREILTRISDEEVTKVGINPKTCRPEWAIITLFLVPAVTVRPSITLEDGQRSEDDLTHKLSDIIRANQRLWENLNAGAPEVIIDDLWDLLQYHVVTFFDNSVARIPPARHRSGQPLKTIAERIKGKEGRIRENLAGKRVNFSSRTVISPDPYLKLNEVGIPFEIAKVITVAEAVNSLNLNKMKELVKKGEEYPGANYIIRPDGKRKKITPELKEEIVAELNIGYKVERHLQDGDVVLFNRHPSLHRGSLMAHFARVLPYRTFRMHPAVCAPYNADFDGDEMNIHSPQTEEAISEAKILLDVNANLISPKNNTNLLGCTQDAITGGYLLAQDKLSKADANQLLYRSNLTPNVSKKEIDGKDVFSEVFPAKIDFYTKIKDKEVEIKNGKLLKGDVDESFFGSENGELLKILDKEVGREKTIGTLRDAFAIGTNYLTGRGFTIALNDLSVDDKIKKSRDDAIAEAEIKSKDIIDAYRKGSLEILPGKSAEETREIRIIQVLNEVRTKMGKVIGEHFPENNPVNTMIHAKSGGNILNITQMACFVGQQVLLSKRIDLGFRGRTLSSFAKGELNPKSKGFIYSSYIKGLDPQEFFFGAMTGRDSLMDTALRTPKSGYLYRRLANALQDLKIEYDGTVRDASGNIIQFIYGDDGLDVTTMHLNQKIAPGEAIGIVTAQSFGEPSTQMVLRTFHVAGVAEMQVTQGLPRLIEIFDARKIPSSPLTEIYLDDAFNDEKNARVIAEKLKETKIEEIVSEININFSGKKVELEISSNGLRQIHMGLDSVVARLKDKGFSVKASGNKIVLDCAEMNFKDIFKLKEKIRKVNISGVKGISQVLVARRDKDFVILAAGSNMKEILAFKGVDKEKTWTNDIHEMAAAYGIEVARQIIINEIKSVLSHQGLDIDIRHLKLVADAMCSSGEIKGITRMGIVSLKSSILARASFETPIKHFISATVKGSKDKLSSVIENIIINQPVPIGTGLPGLLVEVTGPLIKESEIKKRVEKKKKE